MIARPDFPLNREACARLLAEPDTTATTLHLILLAEFGDDLYGGEENVTMDPVLIWRLARERFSVTIPEENENKINALMLAVSSDKFYDEPLVFISVCMALYSGDLGDLVTGYMEDPTLNELLWGIFEVALNRDDDMEFSDAVYQVVIKESQEAIEEFTEEDSAEFRYFERELISGKSKIIREFGLIGAPEFALEQVKNFDATPVHDSEGNLMTTDGVIISPWITEQ